MNAEVEKGSALYKIIDHLIWAYFDKRDYKNAADALLMDSIWLRRKDDRPIVVQSTLYEKHLDDIIELFFHYGRFDVPPELLYMEQQLRQLSNQFTESLVNYSQINKKKYSNRHSRFLLNQRLFNSHNISGLKDAATSRSSCNDFNIEKTLPEFAERERESAPQQFLEQKNYQKKTSATVCVDDESNTLFEDSTFDKPSNDGNITDEGLSRRKSKPHNVPVTRIKETFETGVLEKINNRAESDSWDLGNEFDSLFGELSLPPDPQVCCQLLLDIFDEHGVQADELTAVNSMDVDKLMDKTTLQNVNVDEIQTTLTETAITSVNAVSIGGPPVFASKKKIWLPSTSILTETPCNKKSTENSSLNARTENNISAPSLEELFGKEEMEYAQEKSEANIKQPGLTPSKHISYKKASPQKSELSKHLKSDSKNNKGVRDIELREDDQSEKGRIEACSRQKSRHRDDRKRKEPFENVRKSEKHSSHRHQNFLQSKSNSRRSSQNSTGSSNFGDRPHRDRPGRSRSPKRYEDKIKREYRWDRTSTSQHKSSESNHDTNPHTAACSETRRTYNQLSLVTNLTNNTENSEKQINDIQSESGKSPNRASSQSVYQQMFPQANLSSIKIPKLKFKENAEERENDKEQQVSSGFGYSKDNIKIVRGTISDARLSSLLLKVGQKRLALKMDTALNQKDDQLEIRSPHVSPVNIDASLLPAIESDSYPKTTLKRRKIDLVQAEEVLNKLHGS